MRKVGRVTHMEIVCFSCTILVKVGPCLKGGYSVCSWKGAALTAKLVDYLHPLRPLADAYAMLSLSHSIPLKDVGVELDIMWYRSSFNLVFTQGSKSAVQPADYSVRRNLS
jgi:hypothetical protein